MTDFKTMTKEEAIEYCYEHQDEYVHNFDTVSEGMRQFECLIAILEYDTITPAELPDYVMDY